MIQANKVLGFEDVDKKINKKITEIENKIPSVNGSVTTATVNTKVLEIENT